MTQPELSPVEVKERKGPPSEEIRAFVLSTLRHYIVEKWADGSWYLEILQNPKQKEAADTETRIKNTAEMNRILEEFGVYQERSFLIRPFLHLIENVLSFIEEQVNDTNLFYHIKRAFDGETGEATGSFYYDEEGNVTEVGSL